jgi:hypothetical protein
MASLTDRYISAVTRSLPASRRVDVASDLRHRIDGMVAERGDEPDAERDVLTELGDPRRVARDIDHRRHRIVGADQFPAYIRVLRDTASLVVPVVAFLGALVRASIPGSDAGSVAWAAVVAGAWAAVSVLVVVTLGYVVIGRLVPAREWTLDDLPSDADHRPIALADVILMAVAVLLGIGVAVWQRALPPITTDGGESVPILSPDLWTPWLWVLFALFIASVALLAAAYRRGRWTMPLAVSNLVVDIVLFVLIVWLAADDRILNPDAQAAIAKELGRDVLPAAPTLLIGVLVGAALAVDAIGPLRAARR